MSEQENGEAFYEEGGEIYEKDSGEQVDESLMRRAVAGAATGNALEWFDFGVYGYFAVAIGEVFFPGEDSNLLASFAVFAVAFVARPLGSFVFGPLGDKIGRKHILIITIMLMSVTTTLVGVLPPYAAIGIWSPILLIILRLLQGFSAGGEYGSAATFICEYAADDRRGMYGSWLEFGTMTGYSLAAALALVLSLLLPTDALHSWGWRIPFLCAAPLGLLGLWLRVHLEDTPAFDELKKSGENEDAPLRVVFRHHWRTMVLCVLLVILLNVAYYTVLKYMPTYLTEALGIGEFQADLLILAITVCIGIVIPFLGRFSDEVGRRPMWFGAAGGFILLSFPAFYLMTLGSFWLALGGLAIIGFFTAVLGSVVASTLPAIFRTNVRNGGFSISYNLSTAAFGGTTPLFMTWLINVFGYELIPAFYLMLAGAIALIPTFMIRESAGAPLLGSKARRGPKSRTLRRATEQKELG